MATHYQCFKIGDPAIPAGATKIGGPFPNQQDCNEDCHPTPTPTSAPTPTPYVECTQCSGPTPTSVGVVISGVTGTCASANGSWTCYRRHISTPCWYWDPSGHVVVIFGAGVEVRYLLNAFDSWSSNVVWKTTHGGLTDCCAQVSPPFSSDWSACSGGGITSSCTVTPVCPAGTPTPT